MRRRLLAGLAVLAFPGLLITRPAAAQQVSTSIDLDYVYQQQNAAGDVKASTAYKQKYEIKYETSLTTAHDFLGAVRLELEDAWNTSEAGSSRVAPTLELQVKGSQAAARLVSESVITTTDAFEESGEVKGYGSSLSGDLLLTSALWPELKLKLQRRSDLTLERTETTTNSLDLSLVKDIRGLRLELSVKREATDDLLPERHTNRDEGWTGKATYKEILWGGTEFELAYEARQSATQERTRGVFTGATEESHRQVRTRLKNSLSLSPRLTLGVSWEYQFEQDLLVLEFDNTLNNKYQLDVRWDLMEWLKFAGEARRETSTTVNDVGLEDDHNLTDSFKGSVDIALVPWLRLAAKAELKNAAAIVPLSGASVDRTSDENYEVVVKNVIGDFWDLTLNGTAASQYADGFLMHREGKLKGELKLKVVELVVQPSYEVSRGTDWQDAIEEPSRQTQSRDARIKFEYKLVLVDLFSATFSHEYGVKVQNDLDEVLNFERALEFTENTRINVAIAEFLRDLRLEGEIDRKASDTEGDTDPELIEVSYALKLDWKLENLSLSSSFKYNDKGGTFDDMSFNTRVGWKGDRLDVSGEYQFDKIFSDLTDENRKLNLKLSYKF